MKTADYSGGAPVIGDSLALDLVNTLYTPRGHLRDGIASDADLAGWLEAVRPRLGSARVGAVATGDVNRFHDLRGTIRSLVESVSSGRPLDSASVAQVNAASRLAPSWTELRLDAETVERTSASDTEGVDATLASLARDAIDLLSGDKAAMLRTCEAHNCSLFFLKDHPRREWCSASCGARVRSARAYARRTAAVDAGDAHSA
jgi:predicted RNA-binding Zn ribbon-like protein